MTALTKFQRLEAQGIWRESADAQRIDVIIAFGDATLTITTNAGAAVSHWSLAAINRLNPERTPALFAPGADSNETLEIDDPDMISAIEQVRDAIVNGGPRPHRLRRLLGIATAACILALAIFWVPGALVSYATSIVPFETRTKIGTSLLAEIRDLSNASCEAPGAQAILARMQDRLGPGFLGRLSVAKGVWPSRSLPGGIVVADARLFEAHDTPDVAAGYILAELQRVNAHDPLAKMMHSIGTMGTIELLTSGELSASRLKTYATDLLAQPPDAVDEIRLNEAFRLTRVNAAPFVRTLSESAADWVDIAKLSGPEVSVTEPVLTDSQWVQLQSVCE